jgi:hypothetical protein
MPGSSTARVHSGADSSNRVNNKRNIIVRAFYSTGRRVTVKFRPRLQLEQKATSWKKPLSTIVF